MKDPSLVEQARMSHEAHRTRRNRARKAGPAVCTYHVWVNAAQLEASCNRNPDVAALLRGTSARVGWFPRFLSFAR